MPGKLSARDWASATLQNAGHRPEENEDAIAAAPARNRFAIADRATGGWEPGLWSAHLANAFIRRSPTPSDFADWLAEVRRAWRPRTVAGAPGWGAGGEKEHGWVRAGLGG